MPFFWTARPFVWPAIKPSLILEVQHDICLVFGKSAVPLRWVRGQLSDVALPQQTMEEVIVHEKGEEKAESGSNGDGPHEFDFWCPWTD